MTTDPTTPTEFSLNIDSIKELMDAFDPASLLPQLDTVFGKIAFGCRLAVMIGPVLLLVLGLSYLFLSPKEANHYLGYRCWFGMGSVQAWRFTQRIAGLGFAALGLVLTVVMLFVGSGFAAMAVEDMVWSALRCLIWQCVLALVLNIAILATAGFFFDAKGEYRRRKK